MTVDEMSRAVDRGVKPRPVQCWARLQAVMAHVTAANAILSQCELLTVDSAQTELDEATALITELLVEAQGKPEEGGS